VAGNGDEDDAADEQLFMQQSLELHYNVAELVGEHSSGIPLPYCPLFGYFFYYRPSKASLVLI
jgi:hypothetical protein